MERGAASVTMQQNEPLDLSCFNNSLSLFPSETSSQNVVKRTICEGIRPSVNSSHRPPEISKVKFLTALELTPVSLKANAHDVPLFGYAVNDACTLGGTRRSLLLRLDDIRPYTSIYWSILAHHNIQPRWTAVNSGAALAEAGKRGKSDDVDMPLDLSVKKLKLELGGSSKSVSKPAVRQKQKRYRTEKPFECKHCTARFTLRSNMIRHMKQQHAEIRKTHLEIAEFLKEQNDLMSDWSREISLGEFGDTPFPMPSSYYFNSRDGDDDDDDVDFIGKEQFVASKKKSAYSTAPNRVSCPYCSREFPWNSSLRRHILTHTGQKPFKCDSCPLLFTTKSNCDRHSSRKHTESRRKTSSNKSSESGDNLGSEHESSQDTQDEEMRGHSETPFKCYLCDSAFPDRQQALDHLKDSHALDYASLLPKGATTACFNSYSSDSADENHERASSTTTAPLVDKKCKRKVICSLCRRRFWSTEDLRRHMRTHTGERPFSCELCSRRFTLKHSMIRHVKKHQSGFKK